MIIFIHGTGDDSSKAENWMPWAAKVMERYGETTLVLPGVASSESNQIARYAQAFFLKIRTMNGRNPTPQNQNFPLLRAALNEAGGSEVLPALNVRPGEEEAFITHFAMNQREESDSYATGIKLRMAVGALCAVAYYRRCPNPRPLRIIGHSRGGSVAVGLHNMLTGYGIVSRRTLTLDPCHGVKKPSHKDYFHKIWDGQLFNIPCVKEVGDVKLISYTFRPAIAVGRGGGAVVANHPKLKVIKHGHMGKMQALPGDEANKRLLRQAIAPAIDRVCGQAFLNAQEHLNEVFTRGTLRGSDYQDKVFIQAKVIETLTT